MPNIKSAKKRVKVAAAKNLQNRMLKGKLKAALKDANAAIEQDAANKQDAVKVAYKVIDQSAAKGIIHKNKAARKKAQIASKMNAAKA
ncbi:MAG TPA: 30S ribosomal protein S20 [Candidatus Merdivicinus faecavium]|nr:30S ribosomal protein S20 [Candidatus Merdivicinus faecavium]